MNWKWRSKAIGGWAGLVAAVAVGARAQTVGSHVAAAPKNLHAVAATEDTLEPKEQVLRQIEDPSTGDLWLLLRDPNRPAGPGRLVLAGQRSNLRGAISGRTAHTLSEKEQLVIHTGDGLVVEEHTAMVDVRLAAMALGPAVKGAEFKARLKIGGNVVSVVALSPGRASIAPESEVTP